MEQSRKPEAVLGHTNFSWTHNHEDVPLGHTQFSWGGEVISSISVAENADKPPIKEGQSTASDKKGEPKPQKKRKAAPPKPVGPPPCKVLCLHGYMQSGPIWEKKTSSFRRCFNKYNMEFVCPTAPNKMDYKTEEGLETFKWMESVPAYDSTTPVFLTTPKYKGMKKSLKFLKQFIADNGPFDGIIGFSQGGVVASLLLAMCNPPTENSTEKKKTRNLQFRFRFGLIIAAFAVPALDYKPVYERLQKQRPDQGVVVDVPTLHIWGAKDDLVPPENSRKLPELFTNAEVYEHSGGHVAPNNSDARKAYHSFLDRVGVLA